jgi:segregation and condensation protein B
MANRPVNRQKRPATAVSRHETLAAPSEFRPAEDAGGLSLDELGAAFAQMLEHGHDPYTGKSDPSDALVYRSAAEAELEPALDPEQAAGVGDGLCQVTPLSIVEAMLFVGSPTNEPLTAQRIASLMRGVRPVEIEELVRELNQGYAANRCPYEIVGTGAGYRLTLRSDFDSLRTRVMHRGRQVRLSESAIEVLAVVAYNEPLTADEVDKLRGRPSGALLRQLLRRQLLMLERADDEAAAAGVAGRPRPAPRYRTTPRFLELVGIESLADLPRAQEIEKR